MQFYNTTSQENSLVHEAWDLVDTNITSYPLAKVTRRFNIAFEKLVGLILNAEGTWEWDDTNYTDLPTGTGTLIEGQESYSFASEYLKIRRVKVKDKNGKWVLLKQFDPQDLEEQGIAVEQFYGTDSSGNPNKGMPEYYDILGDTIRLYPAPTSTSVTLASGLKVDFARSIDLFTVSDTTQQPGLPSPYHFLLPTWAALQYAKSYKKDLIPILKTDWNEGVEELLKHFSKRNINRRSIMTHKRIAYI